MPFVPDPPQQAEKKGRFIPDAPTAETVTVPQYDPMGMPTGFETQVAKAKYDPVGIGTKVAVMEPIYAAGEYIPGEVGKASARRAKQLEKEWEETARKYPVASRLGYYGTNLAGLLAGGEALQALRAPAIAAEALPVGQRLVQAAKTGAIGGAGLGALQPTGEEEAGKFAREKAWQVLGGAALGGVLGPVAVGIPIAYKATKETLRRAFGGEAGEAAKELQDVATEIVSAQKTAKEAAAATETQRVQNLAKEQSDVALESQAKLERIAGQQQQIAQRDAIVKQRVKARAGLAEIETFADVREAVLAKTRDRVRQAEEQARKAGLNTQETIAHVASVEEMAVKAEQEVAALERELLSRPQMTGEELGKMTSGAAQKILDDGIKVRERQSGFGEAIRSAGNAPIVPTQKIINKIDRIVKNSRDPQIINALETIKSQLTTVYKRKEVPALNIEQADSLRKVLDRIRRTKTIQYANGTTGDAAAALNHIDDVKSLLVGAATKAHAPYGAAVSKYRDLSRPLDIVQRKGALRYAVDKDNLSQELLRGYAEIAGRVIQQAKQGKQVFARLLEVDPNIKNGARAFFNRELFGGDKVPSVDRLKSFLMTNEGPLRQLGLYEEFSTIASARAAGNQALERVASEIKQAKQAVKVATEAEREAQKSITEAERVRSAAVKRQAEAEKQTIVLEDTVKAGRARASEATARLEKTAQEIEKEASKKITKIETEKVGAQHEAKTATERARDLEARLVEISQEPIESVARKTESVFKELVNKKEITPEQYEKFLTQVRMVENAYGKTKEARKRLLKIAIGAASLVGAGDVLLRVKSYIGD